MAKLIVPDNCSECGVVFMEHDVIILERQARLKQATRGGLVIENGVRRYARLPVLEPRIASISPKNVRHKVCPT